MLGQRWNLSLSEAKALYCCDCGTYNPDGAFLRGKAFAKNLGDKIQLEIAQKYYFEQHKRFERTHNTTKTKYLLFGFLPLFKTKTWHESNRGFCYFLGIPVIKFKKNWNCSKAKWYLFGLIPIMKVKKY
jgi:hypothetical protein